MKTTLAFDCFQQVSVKKLALWSEKLALSFFQSQTSSFGHQTLSRFNLGGFWKFLSL
jgi:hypothetical protein